ncbi:phenylacetic acid degradation bifunctional protein PaaZ [Gracilimonas sp. BCB1]|uniref:phenylacetic acid degradation bifunctional protein PaaZ n=1 Tax=Gracilimonas sp. BCB1 TaxID=3152362 RepID=UPI0032D8F895
MIKVQSYIQGEWLANGNEIDLISAVTNEPVAQMVEADIDYNEALKYARTVGGPKLREMTIHERAFSIKFLGKYLMERKEKYYEISSHTGATRQDSWIDIEGGIITAFGISSKSRRHLSDLPWHVEGDTERLSRKGSFMGQHICVPRHGVAVHINAFNFPVWGMLEKLAPAIISGMPVIVKPSPVGSYLAWEVFKDMIESEILPEGTIQYIAADKPGDLLDRLISQDMVAFTGSASTGRKLKAHPNIIANNVPFNLEADSLNCSILGKDVTPDMEEFDLFIKEVVREMTVKTGQKCTAIRRTIIPRDMIIEVTNALSERLDKITIGDPANKETRMGPLASTLQRERFDEQFQTLEDGLHVVYSGDSSDGAYTSPKVLLAHQSYDGDDMHHIEAFGPLTTVMAYDTTEEAIDIANMANGALVGSLFTADDEIAHKVAMGCAPYHGRFMVINRNSAEESTGHGSPIASLVHGGPGHAGGGEELGGARAVLHNMQRVALQGSPTTLRNIVNQHIKGAETEESDKHPFQKYFEELKIGEALTTDKRTVTEKDVEEFAELSGDHFYAHTDPEAASRSLFGKIVAHGYFVLSATAGLFVDPDEGPVMLNYGLENLRFVAPVAPGDTIQAKLILKRKNVRQQKKDDPFPFGVVYWDVEVTNQEDVIVAEYTILTLMKRKNKLPIDEK